MAEHFVEAGEVKKLIFERQHGRSSYLGWGNHMLPHAETKELSDSSDG